jgi:hypothetical protein
MNRKKYAELNNQTGNPDGAREAAQCSVSDAGGTRNIFLK